MYAVVILNWNGSGMLRRFLPSVLKYSREDGGEVYVADNGSTDDSVEMLRKEFQAVHLIILSQNYGFAEGYNRALRQVEARYVVLLNSDVEVTRHWLRPLVDYLEVHPQVAACQPKLRSWHHRGQFEYAGAAGGYLDRFGYPYCRGRLMGTVEADTGQYDDEAQLLWASGAALCIRKADYEAVGGLDGRFFAHMEEIDLCWRLRSRGRQVVCLSQSVVYHVGAATLRRESPRKTYLNFRNNLLMLYKNLPEDELKSVMRVRLWLDYLAAFSFLLKGQWDNARAVWKARRDYHRLRPDYASARSENLRAAVCTVLPQRAPFSLLWQYYAKGKRRFSQLPPME